MKRARPWLLAWLLLLLPGIAVAAENSSGSEVLELKQRLDRVSLDPARAYQVRDLRLRRDEVRLILEQGRLIFLEPVAGQVTGALFVGEGSILVLPRQKVERAQLARFSGAPILDEHFSSAYLRFTDASFGELLHAIERSGSREFRDPEFFAKWNPIVRNLNPQHSLRILADLLIKRPRPIFAVALVGARLGAIDVRVDGRLDEQITIGQSYWSGAEPGYDVWCSFTRRSAEGSAPVLPTFRPVRYRIQTRIEPTKVLEGETELEMLALVGGERLFALELARPLEVKSVTDGEGRSLVWFDRPGDVTGGGPRASDLLVIALPEATEEGRTYRVRLHYAGAVIYDLGNGVLYVGSRGSWYPNLGMGTQAEFDLSFEYPKRLVLVATGRKESETTSDEWKRAHWLSDGPVSVAGFNLGDYQVRELREKSLAVAVYANRQLERPLQPQPLAAVPLILPDNPSLGRRLPLDLQRPEAAVSPVAAAETLARDALDAIRFFENYFGPFPYPTLAISQIPGNFGQGWPGLMYLSTFSFLRPLDQARVGLSERSREFFTDLVPFHETAHQWWGNLVGWEDYRDQWVSEGISSFAGLLYLEKKRNDSRGMQTWLKKYKQDLLAKGADGRTVEQAGPLWLGKRLNSSSMPHAYEQIVYGKGAWVLHMLRELYREPAKGGGTSDEKFRQALRAFAAQYSHRAATTEDFRRTLEKFMPASLDLDENGRLEWFFDEWVYDTGIPHYKLESSAKLDGQRYQVRGKIRQRDVPEEFVMPVPVYAETPRGKLVFLGRVVVRGEETTFRFTTAFKPAKVVLDPYNTILAVVD